MVESKLGFVDRLLPDDTKVVPVQGRSMGNFKYQYNTNPSIDELQPARKYDLMNQNKTNQQAFAARNTSLNSTEHKFETLG